MQDSSADRITVMVSLLDPKTFCRPIYFLGTWFPGSTTFCTSGDEGGWTKVRRMEGDSEYFEGFVSPHPIKSKAHCSREGPLQELE